MKPTITYDDFSRLDLRVGKVVAASLPDWSNKLIRYEVDFGQEIGKRVLFSGIRKWYTPESLINKSFIFVVNLEVKKMGDEQSQGMMLMVDSEKPVLFTLMEEVPAGSVVR